MKFSFKDYIDRHRRLLDFLEANEAKIGEIARLFISTLSGGNKLIFAGNGGSAADAQHLAAEFVGRFKQERESLPALALTVNTSILTAIANDYNFSDIFSRQLCALAKEGDLFIGISTSGNSENVLEAIKTAKTKNITSIAFLGKNGGRIKDFADISIIVPSENTALIQEMHITIGHIICAIVDENFAK